MSDAQALSRNATPPATARRSPDDDTATSRGVVNAVLLSLPLWGLIGIAVAALL